jgi:signal transduction histidine kinase
LDAAQQPAFKALLEQCLNQGKVFRFDITLGDQWLEAILSPLQPAPLEGDEPLLTPIIPQRDEPQAVKVSAEALPAEAASLSDEKPPCFEAAVLTLRDVTAQRETERLREDFVSTLTHDLRTPLLAAIQTFGFFQDGSLGPLAQRQQQMMSLLQDSHRDLLGLVNTLLEVYKYEANQQRLVKTQLNLLELAKTVVAELAPLAQSKGQTLRLDADTSIPLQCRADRQELRRVLMNLVGNAIHHTPGAGEITLAVDKQAAMMRLRVLDTGPGIPKVDCAKLFQRFSQGTSRKRNSGTGLGLYLSRQIVEAHGGRIAVASEEGAGSCFTVQLPV